MPNGFPEGDFRIINQDTGVRLFTYDNGSYSTSIDAKSSTSHATGKIAANIALNPSFGVGFPGNKGDDLWWFHQARDASGRPTDNYLMSHLKVTNGSFALQVEWLSADIPPELEMWGDICNSPSLGEILRAPLKDLVAGDFAYYFSLPNQEVTPDAIAKGIPLLFPEKVLSHSSEELSRLSLADLLTEVSEELSDIPSDEPSHIVLATVELVLLDRWEKYSTRSKAYLTLWGWGRQHVSKWQAEDGYIFLQDEPEQVLTVVKNGESYNATLADRGASNQTWRF